MQYLYGLLTAVCISMKNVVMKKIIYIICACCTMFAVACGEGEPGGSGNDGSGGDGDVVQPDEPATPTDAMFLVKSINLVSGEDDSLKEDMNFEYDAQGRILSETTTTYVDGVVRYVDETVYTYSENSIEIRTELRDAAGQVDTEEVYVGRLGASGYIESYEESYTEFDGNGVNNYTTQWTGEISYDQNGFIKSSRIYRTSGDVIVNEFVWTDGNLTGHREYRSDGELSSEETATYHQDIPNDTRTSIDWNTFVLRMVSEFFYYDMPDWGLHILYGERSANMVATTSDWMTEISYEFDSHDRVTVIDTEYQRITVTYME